MNSEPSKKIKDEPEIKTKDKTKLVINSQMELF